MRKLQAFVDVNLKDKNFPFSGVSRTIPFGWIDDACMLAISSSYAENQSLLERALDKAAVWSKSHSSKFAPDNFELIHFRNPKAPDPVTERGPLRSATPWSNSPRSTWPSQKGRT